MNNLMTCCGLAVGLMTAVAAHADAGMTGDVGTTGIGFHTSIPLLPHFAARVGMGYLDYSNSGSTGSLDYDLGLKAKTWDVLLDCIRRRTARFA